MPGACVFPELRYISSLRYLIKGVSHSFTIGHMRALDENGIQIAVDQVNSCEAFIVSLLLLNAIDSTLNRNQPLVLACAEHK